MAQEHELTAQQEKAMDWFLQDAWGQKQASGENTMPEKEFKAQLRSAVIHGGEAVLNELSAKHKAYLMDQGFLSGLSGPGLSR